MRNTLSSVFIFAVGAVVGSAVTWKFVKTKYEQIAQEEIDSVKEAFTGKTPNKLEWDHSGSKPIGKVESVAERGDGVEVTVSQLDLKDYAEQLQDMDYVDYSSNSRPNVEPKQKKVEEDAVKPYTIDPDEFGHDGYSATFLTYYADGVLAYDDNDEIIEDVGSIVGDNFSEHFGDYEDNVVHIRNEEEQRDYEITKDLRKYTDVVDESPHQAEDEWEETK